MAYLYRRQGSICVQYRVTNVKKIISLEDFCKYNVNWKDKLT